MVLRGAMMTLTILDVVSNDLMETINDLAEVVKIKNEGAKELGSVDLKKVMEKVKESMSQVIKDKKAVLNIDFNGTNEIYAPKTYIDSIFLNLTSNALKYSKDDVPPVINVYAEQKDDRFEIHFSDNGLGIDLQKHGSKMFGLRKTFHRNKDSRGVGLFLTKAQIEAMGGEIDVKSIPDEGTEFIISLPKSILTQ